ncbi:hypothetical protein [Lewinella sp. IMCC34191]|uniref:hypothetical protein n=1 Tax=Lewinella sp. IMCC34191 TaxID=2259172 RepID=UPI000E246F66|nr:hypothetical protein [Lewinella sp. IMCC34191]
MKEKNYRTLREALDRLPNYDALGDSWSAIDGKLNQATSGASAPLGSRLPTHAPPPGVWNTISKELDEDKRARMRRLPLRRWTSVAAAAAVLLLFVTVFLLYDGGPEISYAYSREAAPEPVVADWDDDENSFQLARREVEERNEPHLNNLGHELDELTSAREEVKAMLVAYGEDPGIVQQLAEIERERDDVYRRIIVEL